MYTYAPKGRRAYNAQVPRNRGANTTLLASMSLESMGPCFAVEGATTATVFEAYVEQLLALRLGREQIVLLDNLGAHKSERARKLTDGGAASCSSCHRTRQTLIPSRKLSRRSRVPGEKPKPKPAKP